MRLDEDVHYKIKYIAKENKRSLNNQLEFLTEEYIRKYEEEKGMIELPEEYK